MKLKSFLPGLSLIGLLLGCFPSFASSLDNWHWRNPLPNGNPLSYPHTLYSVIFTNGYFIAVGDAGTVSISSDGTNWTESATATTNQLNDIISADGLFLAVGNNGTVETSSNGTNWVLQASGTTNSLTVATYGEGKFIVAGGNAVITSPDAINWSANVSGLSGAIGLASSGSEFVAITGSNQVFSSSDGLTWTGQTLTAPGSSFGSSTLRNSIITYAKGSYFIGSYRYATSESADSFVFSSVDGVNWATNVVGNFIVYADVFYYSFFFSGTADLVMAGTGPLPFLQFSADGMNWATTNQLPDSSVDGQGFSGTYGNGVYVIVGGLSLPVNNFSTPIFTSTNALDWVDQQRAPAPPAGPTNIFTSIAFTNGIYVVATSNSIVRSTDGLSYSTVANSPGLASIITGSSGFIGVGAGGTVYVSGDGLSWTQRNSGTLNNLHSISASGSLLVAVGDAGAIQTSTSGNVWTTRSSGTSLALDGVAYANGLFVAVGQLGTVLTSPDGVNWTGQYSGQLTNLLSITYGSAAFTAVGAGGIILTSPDGINWTPQNSGTSATLESITFGNGYYLATGDDAAALTSPDGTTWTPRNLGAIGGQNLYGAAFLNNRFDVVGSYGTILESDPVTPLFDVQIHANGNWLTAFVPAGSSFRIQTSTNLIDPVWIDAATFNNASAITQWTNNISGSSQLFYRAVSP